MVFRLFTFIEEMRGEIALREPFKLHRSTSTRSNIQIITIKHTNFISESSFKGKEFELIKVETK